MMTAMPRKTSLENKHLHNRDYFAIIIIPFCLNEAMLAKYVYTTTGLQGA